MHFWNATAIGLLQVTSVNCNQSFHISHILMNPRWTSLHRSYFRNKYIHLDEEEKINATQLGVLTSHCQNCAESIPVDMSKEKQNVWLPLQYRHSFLRVNTARRSMVACTQTCTSRSNHFGQWYTQELRQHELLRVSWQLPDCQLRNCFRFYGCDWSEPTRSLKV